MANMKTNKRDGFVREVSRHETLAEAYDAYEGLEFKRGTSLFEITLDNEGDEDFDPIEWQTVFERLSA